MGWEFETGEHTHEGYLLPEFGDGTLGSSGTTGAPDGSVHVIISFGDGDSESRVTRPVAQITGWRIACDCYRSGSFQRSEAWVSPTQWVRVPSAALQDVAAGKIYASDDDVADVSLRADVEAAVLTLLRREHLDGDIAIVEIQAARQELANAQGRLDAAVQAARAAGLSWAAIGDAAGMTGQSAHQRWSKSQRVTKRVASLETS
jgi:hypothetical protein